MSEPIDQNRQSCAIFHAGELAGLAMKLDAEALRAYLDKEPSLRGPYVKMCYAALEFRTAIDLALSQ